MTMPPRVAFSTLAFPDAILTSAASLGRSWGYSGIELRLIDGELIDPAMPAADRTQVKRAVTASGLSVVAVDSSVRLTGEDPAPELARFLELASDWEAPLVRGRGTSQGHARAAGGRGVPALDLGRVGKALAPRDRGARGGAPPAPRAAH